MSKTLESFADEKAQAQYAENQEIARNLRAARALAREREDELHDVKRRLEIYESLDEAILAPPKWLAPKKQSKKSAAIPSLLITDIHWGDHVISQEIADINAYDTAIAEKRIRRAAEGTVKLCRDYLSGLDYEGIQVMLGGDLLSGEIHDELRETNAETTTESIVGVLESLVGAMRVLADSFGKVHVGAVVGNHGRTTRKPRAKRKPKDNYDWLVYQLLARELRADERITMQVADATDLHFSVYGTRYCLSHGDQFRGGSGISAALAPLLLGVHRKRRRDAQAGNPWDVLVIGHFHESYFLRDLIVGGSVIGYTEYAYTRNLTVEQPLAALWINTPTRGITTYNPVHLMDREAEGW